MRTFKYYVSIVRQPDTTPTKYYGLIPVANIAIEIDNPDDLLTIREGIRTIIQQCLTEEKEIPQSRGYYYIRSDTSRWLRLRGQDPIGDFLDIKEILVTV